MVSMGEVGTVTSKSMVTIPSRLRKKLDLRQGSKVEFMEVEEGLLIIPIRTLDELRGAGKNKKGMLLKAVRELDIEHRVEAKR